MKAHTTTTTTRSMPKRIVLALAIGVSSLAIPSTATAAPVDPPTSYSSATAITGSESDSAEPAGGSDYSSVNAIMGESSTPAGAQGGGSGYSSVTAITGPPPSEPTLASSSQADADDGFDWLSAAIGAGAAMALAALGTVALVTVRSRTSVSPSAAATS